ncbi:hypothetical protein MASR2M117_21120 [Paludibacter sp.]
MNLNFKKTFSLIIIFIASGVFFINAQQLTEKREIRKKLTIKEYKVDPKGKDKTLDAEIKYNDKGYKVEETEYATNGMKARTTYEYDQNNRCIKEILYDERNKIKRIRKIEYNQDGTKKAHYNYLPNGRLYSIKQFEYIY